MCHSKYLSPLFICILRHTVQVSPSCQLKLSHPARNETYNEGTHDTTDIWTEVLDTIDYNTFEDFVYDCTCSENVPTYESPTDSPSFLSQFNVLTIG